MYFLVYHQQLPIFYQSHTFLFFLPLFLVILKQFQHFTGIYTSFVDFFLLLSSFWQVLLIFPLMLSFNIHLFKLKSWVKTIKSIMVQVACRYGKHYEGDVWILMFGNIVLRFSRFLEFTMFFFTSSGLFFLFLKNMNFASST